MMNARIIVEVRFGPMQGRKALIERGGRLEVGRTERADLSIGHDTQMSGKHFALSWDGETCRLDDLGSPKGTRVAGQIVEHAEIQHGSWIRAGGTDFLVHVEGKIPPRDEPDGDDDSVDPALHARRLRVREAKQIALEKALSTLRAEARASKLHAVLDAARSDRILELLRQNVEPHRSLYEGIEGETLADVAPYLVGPLKEDSSLLEALVREGWGGRWGIFISSAERSFEDVRRHLRRFLMVSDAQTGERLYFRFYDPTVMKVFMASSPKLAASDFWQMFSAIFVDDTSVGALRITSKEAPC